MKTNVCHSQAKYLAKTFETLIKKVYMLLCATKHPILLASPFTSEPYVRMSSFFLRPPDSCLMTSECQVRNSFFSGRNDCNLFYLTTKIFVALSKRF